MKPMKGRSGDEQVCGVAQGDGILLRGKTPQ
jgi:hypothetical protein